MHYFNALLRTYSLALISTLLLLFTLVISEARAATVMDQDGALGWKTVTDGEGDMFFADPEAACYKQWESFTNGTGSFNGANATSVWSAYKCDWSGALPYPSSVYFACDAGYTRLAPGVCVPQVYEPRPCPHEDNRCNGQLEGAGGFPTLGAGDPIEIVSGRLFENVTDFETSDGRLYLRRNYTSSYGEAYYLEEGALRGAGAGWAFEAIGATLKLDPNFAINRTADFFLSNGLHYRFHMNASTGEFSAWGYNNLDQFTRSRFDIELVGSLPSNLNDIVTYAQDFIVTDHLRGQTYEVSTYQNPVSSKYTTGYADKITWLNGYDWEFTYGSNEELTTITDSYGRELTFDWEFGPNGLAASAPLYITQVGLPDGTALVYDYDKQDFTTSGVASPHDRLSKVEWLVDPAASGAANIIQETNYAHEDGRYWHFITGMDDSRAERYQTWTFDGKGRAISSAMGDGAEEYTFSYAEPSPWVRTTTVTNPLGKQATYEFDISGTYWLLSEVDWAASTNSPAATRTFTYANRVVSSMTNEEGFTTTFARNSDSLPTQITLADGTSEEWEHNLTWRSDWQIEEIEAPGLTTEFNYTGDLLTNVTQTDTTSHTSPYATNGDTRSWDYTYTSEGKVASIDGPLSGTSDTVSFTYDADGYLATHTDELGHVTEILSVDDFGRPTSIEDPNGIITDLTYSNAGYLEEVNIDPTGADLVITMAYNEVGDVTSIVRGDGSSLTYTYDEARRLTSVTDALGSVITYTLDDMGGITATNIHNPTSTLIFTQSQTFDELGRLLTRVGAGSETWEYDYDKLSNLVGITDPRTNDQSFAYNGLSELIETVDQANYDTDFAVDDQGEIASVTDPRAIVTSYVRNGWGEIIQETSPDVGTLVYVRNALGLVTEQTDARSVVKQMTYDSAGRLTAISYPASSSENVTYTYDDVSGGNLGLGRLTRIEDEAGDTDIVYNSLGLIASETLYVLGGSGTTSYGYDDAGNVETVTYPSGRIVTYSRDAVGEIDSVSMQASASDPSVNIATGIDWHPYGALQAFTFENGLSLWKVFDNNYRLDQLGYYDVNTPVMEHSYGYADNLNLTAIWDNLNAANDETYWYSYNNRLQDGDGPWGDNTYYQDGVGNLTVRINDDGATTTTDEFWYSSTANQLTAMDRNSNTVRTFTHDSAGNLLSDTQSGVTRTYGYNHANRMSSFAQGSTSMGAYTYNARQQLVIRTVTNTSNNGTWVYVYDQDGHIIAEYDGTTGNLLREYVWLGDVPLAVIDPGTTSSTTYYVHVDHLNRPVALSNAAKTMVANYVWLPYGGLYSYSGSEEIDLRFPGQIIQEESGLHYNWHRNYDPTTGRYTQADPLGLEAGISRYAYVANDPLQKVDPRGLQQEEPFLGLGAFPFEYHQRVIEPSLDLYHNFPSAYDTEICTFGSLCKIGIASYLPELGRYEQFCIPGTLNGVEGVYEVGYETPLNPFSS